MGPISRLSGRENEGYFGRFERRNLIESSREKVSFQEISPPPPKDESRNLQTPKIQNVSHEIEQELFRLIIAALHIAINIRYLELMIE